MYDGLTGILHAYKDVFGTLPDDNREIQKIIEEWKYNMIKQFRMLYSYGYLARTEFNELWLMLIAIQEEFS